VWFLRYASEETDRQMCMLKTIFASTCMDRYTCRVCSGTYIYFLSLCHFLLSSRVIATDGDAQADTGLF